MLIDIRHKIEDIKTPAAIEKCKEYSDKPEELENLILSIDFSLQFTGVKPYFGDKQERLTGIFTLKRGLASINIDFGFSIHDTFVILCLKNPINLYDTRKQIFNITGIDSVKETPASIKNKYNDFLDSLLYTILTSVKSGFYIPTSFSNFCDEFGYNSDSIKDRELFLRCLELKSDLEVIFRENEIDCLPS